MLGFSCTTDSLLSDKAVKMASLSFFSHYDISLTSTSTIVSVVGLLLLTNVLHRFLRWRRLRHVPGPPLAGWTSLWLTRHYINSEVLNEVPRLTAKYGPVVRVGPNKVICSDIDALCKISSVRSLYRKDEWYSVARISRRGDHILTLLDPEARRERKKFIGPAVRILLSLEKPCDSSDNRPWVPNSTLGGAEWILNRALTVPSPLSST
jgi:hypothetical protein